MTTDVIVEFYNSMPFPNNPSIINDIRQVYEKLMVNDFEPINILVAGCGTGEDIIVLHELFPNARIVGIDPSFASIKIAQEQCPYASILPYRIEDDALMERFDLVVCTGVLHHLQNPSEALSLLTKRMYPKALLWIGVYSHGRWEAKTEGCTSQQVFDATINPREKSYSLRQFRNLINETGLEYKKFGHPLPIPRFDLMDCMYDALFIYKRQPLLFAVLSKVKE